MKKHLKQSDLKLHVNNRIVDCEAVEIFNISKISLDDASILADSIFKDINVNTLTLAFYSSVGQVCVADLLSHIKRHTLMYVIQESSDYHMKVTFVTSIPWITFKHLFNRQLDICREIYKCNVHTLL